MGTFDPSKYKHGDVVAGNGRPPNSDMIIVVDSDIWRPLAFPIGKRVLAYMPTDLRAKVEGRKDGYTGTYLDFMIMFSSFNAVRSIVTTGTGEEECTHRIRISDGRKLEEPVHIRIHNKPEYPEIGVLEEFFPRMMHFNSDGSKVKGFPVDKKRSGQLSGKFEVRATTKCDEHLSSVLDLWRSGNRPELLRHLDMSAKNLGEVTDFVYSVYEKTTPGPVYVVMNDRRGRDSFRGNTTKNGRAIGVLDLAGLLRAMIESGFLYERFNFLHSAQGRTYVRGSYAEDLFIAIREDINKQYAVERSGGGVAVHHWKDYIDDVGKFKDGVRGLTLLERMRGKAIFWDPKEAAAKVAMEKVDKVPAPPELRDRVAGELKPDTVAQQVTAEGRTQERDKQP